LTCSAKWLNDYRYRWIEEFLERLEACSMPADRGLIIARVLVAANAEREVRCLGTQVGFDMHEDAFALISRVSEYHESGGSYLDKG
jgi:hypothetical protein